MKIDVLVRNKAAATSALFVVGLALALIAVLQAQPRLFTPSIPLMEPWIQPTPAEPSAALSLRAPTDRCRSYRDGRPEARRADRRGGRMDPAVAR